MRIAVIAPPWLPVPPPSYGGIEAVVDELCRGFHDQGHDVLLFTTGDSTCPVAKASLYDRAQGFDGGSLIEIRHVMHAYEHALDYDIVHDNTGLGPIYAERYPDLPVATTNHGPFNAELNDLYRATQHRVALIAISYHQASTASGVEISRVIHHGVDPTAYPVGNGRGNYFVFLGRMTPDKGAREAVLVAKESGVSLLLAAKMREPLEREYFQEQVRPLLDDKIRYVGEVDHAHKVALLGEAQALVNPIRWPEPFGLVMIEALACGTPVIAFAQGAAPEIISPGLTGFLCRDVDDAAQRIHEVGQLDRQACRQSVESHFSTRRMVDEHLDLFSSLLLERGQKG